MAESVAVATRMAQLARDRGFQAELREIRESPARRAEAMQGWKRWAQQVAMMRPEDWRFIYISPEGAEVEAEAAIRLIARV